jgi:SAM-dependent methyltransferase
MKTDKKHWTQVMFIDKAKIFLHWMDIHWQYAPRTVRQIRKILKEYDITKGKFLELGCGNGRICIHMAKQGFNVTGVDISRLYINEAKKRSRRINAQARFLQGDIRKIDKIVRGKFDIVLSIWTSLGFYNRKTDEALFKKVARLLKKGGVFLILNTMSRERLLKIFCPRLYEETDKYVKLNIINYDQMHSIINNKWIFYRKKGRDLLYEEEIDFDLRIYALPELVDMGERVGLKYKQAYDSIITLDPVQTTSSANLVFQRE